MNSELERTKNKLFTRFVEIKQLKSSTNIEDRLEVCQQQIANKEKGLHSCTERLAQVQDYSQDSKIGCKPNKIMMLKARALNDC